MKGASKVIMGATLVMVATLAIVLGLILVLLAELYCSLLLRRRKIKKSTSIPNTTLPTTVAQIISAGTATHENQTQSTSPLSSFYSQGVLHAPRNLLFPLVPCKETKFELHPSFYGQDSPKTGFHTSPSRTPSSVEEITIKLDDCSTSTPPCNDRGKSGFLYISNPIYDNDATNAETPFETPDTSPSRLEDGCSCSSDDGECESTNAVCKLPSPLTPPLTPMKKLPAQACSVPLRDHVRSLGTSSNNDTNSNIGLSSSSSGSPCTSPSW